MNFWTSIKATFRVSARSTRLALVAIGMFLTCVPSFSQVSQGRILGSIADQSGGVVSGAMVAVVDVARGVSRDLTTDSSGEFAAPALTPGTYTVRAEAKGFKVAERQNILVLVGRDTRVDLTLQPGDQAQTVTITEALPVINTTNAELSGDVEDRQYVDLPVAGRQFYHMLDFQPGVLAIPGGDSIGYVSNGGRQSTTVWMLDGVEETELWSGTGPVVGQRQASILPTDAIQGTSVIQNPGAQYGWREGSVVNVGIKSGTNSLHGTGFFYVRNTALDARNPFLAVTDPKQTDSIKDFGGSIGGPIKKDRMFFFGAYEGQWFAVGNPGTVQGPTLLPGALTKDLVNSIPDAIADLNTYIAGHPGTVVSLSSMSLKMAGCPDNSTIRTSTTPATIAAACNAANGLFGSFNSQGQRVNSFNDEGHSHNMLAKFDYHPSASHSINAEYFYGKGYEFVPASIQPYFNESTPQFSELGRAVWVWVPNSRWVNEARFGTDLSTANTLPGACFRNEGTPDYAAQFGFTPGTPALIGDCHGFSDTVIGSMTHLGFLNGGTTSNITHWVGLDTLSYTRGTHAFKFGGEFHLIKFTGAGKLVGRTGTISFGNGGAVNAFSPTNPPLSVNAAATATALEDFLAGVPDSGTALVGDAERHIRQKRYALFVQDDWRITPRVTLNLGLRYEHSTPIRDLDQGLANFDPLSPTGMVQETADKGVYSMPQTFGPRLGIVWDVTGKGSTVIRASGTMVYENIINYNSLIRQTFGAALQQVPTGAVLYLPDHSIRPPSGTNGIGTVQLTGDIPGGTSQGQLQWKENQTIFLTASQAIKCGNGLAYPDPDGPGPLLAGTNPAPCTLHVMTPKLPGSPFTTWTLSVTHAFTNNFALTAAYVGTHGSGLIGVIDVNSPTMGVAGSSAELQRRPYYGQFPYLGQIRQVQGNLRSNYNSLQVYATKRMSHGVSFAANYTFSHSLDQNSSVSSFNAYDNLNPGLNYGNSATDVRNHFTFTATYQIPGKKAPGQVLEGWQVSSSLNLLGRFPFNSLDSSSDISGTGEKADRWTLLGDPRTFKGGYLAQLPCWGVWDPASGKTSKFAAASNCTKVTNVALMPGLCQQAALAEPTNPSVPAGALSTGILALGGGTPAQLTSEYGCYFSGGAAIVPPAQGTQGNMAKNLLRKSPFREWDLSISKEFKFRERYAVQVRGDFFNILNSVEYGTPSGNPTNPKTFGQAQGTISSSGTVTRSGAPRNVMLGARFTF